MRRKSKKLIDLAFMMEAKPLLKNWKNLPPTQTMTLLEQFLEVPLKATDIDRSNIYCTISAIALESFTSTQRLSPLYLLDEYRPLAAIAKEIKEHLEYIIKNSKKVIKPRIQSISQGLQVEPVIKFMDLIKSPFEEQSGSKHVKQKKTQPELIAISRAILRNLYASKQAINMERIKIVTIELMDALSTKHSISSDDTKDNLQNDTNILMKLIKGDKGSRAVSKLLNGSFPVREAVNFDPLDWTPEETLLENQRLRDLELAANEVDYELRMHRQLSRQSE